MRGVDTTLLRQFIAAVGAEQAKLELKWMKQAATGFSLESMVKRRIHHEPLQYILGEETRVVACAALRIRISPRSRYSRIISLTGSQPFGTLNLIVRPPVLIPRPETEDWAIRLAERVNADQALLARPERLNLLDLGTGSGCIPLLLCSMLPHGQITARGVDISHEAISLANENAALCGFTDPRGNTFHAAHSDYLTSDFSPPEPVDILVANPPYISTETILEDDVVRYEDPRALFGGPTGLDYYHSIAALCQKSNFLTPDAIVAVEVGYQQASAVRNIFESVGLTGMEIWRDPWQVERTVFGRR